MVTIAFSFPSSNPNASLWFPKADLAMTLPANFSEMTLPVKHYFTSYRALTDVELALDEFEAATPRYWDWRVRWSGICSLLRATGHLLFTKDANSCLPEGITTEIKSLFTSLNRNNPDARIFWHFIKKERDSILKEYRFSTIEARLKADGAIEPIRSLLTIDDDDGSIVKRGMFILHGEYKGRDALDVAREAANWWRGHILGIIDRAGFDPDQYVRAADFLGSPILRSWPKSV